MIMKSMGKSSISPSMVLSYLTSIPHHNLYVYPSKARILLCAKEAIIRFPAVVLFTAKSLQVMFIKFISMDTMRLRSNFVQEALLFLLFWPGPGLLLLLLVLLNLYITICLG